MANLSEDEIRVLKEKILDRINTDDALLNFRHFIEDKKVTIFLGNTRSGKSTLVNYLLGNRFVSVEKEHTHNQFKLELHEDCDGPRVGYGSLSVTDFPNVYSAPNGDVLIDSPGFEDNRGIAQDIFNGLCVNQIRFASHIKFVLVSYIHDLVGDNIRNFTNLLSQMTNIVTNIENVQNSVCIIFTKDRDNYQTEELNTIMRTAILNQQDLDIDRRLLRSLTTRTDLIGIFKMPARAGAVILNELDVNIQNAIEACEFTSVEELNIRCALSDDSNLFLRGVYPEYTNTLFFDSEIYRTIEDYRNYFDVDLYVFASFEEELAAVMTVLNTLNTALTAELEGDTIIDSMQKIEESLERLLESREMRLSFENFLSRFNFILFLDNANLFEDNCKVIVLQNYRNSVTEIRRLIRSLITKIEDEHASRRSNRMAGLFQASLFAGGIVPTSMGFLRVVQALVPEGVTIRGASTFVAAETTVGTAVTVSACVLGGVAVGASLGAGYMLIKDTIIRRINLRKEQNR